MRCRLHLDGQLMFVRQIALQEHLCGAESPIFDGKHRRYACIAWMSDPVPMIRIMRFRL